MLDAKSAASLLGVKKQTLYAYVSRGLIRTAIREGTKASLYHKDDIEALRQGRRVTGTAPDSNERAIRWGGGAQVLQTGVTAIDAAGPRYRGKLAVELAQARRPFEDCVELLWSGALPRQAVVWHPPTLPAAFEAIVEDFAEVARLGTTRQLLSLAVQTYAVCSGRNAEATMGGPVLAGRQLVQIMAAAVGLLADPPAYAPARQAQSIATTLAEGMHLPASPQVLRLLDAALVVSADHELAPSTYAARVAASAGGDIFACVTSALGTFEGPLTGFACDESESLLRETGTPEAYVQALRDLADRKEGIPGYNHPLYEQGDPRALYLLKLVRELPDLPPAAQRVIGCIDAGSAQAGFAPSLAVSLVAMSAALGMPAGAPGAIMAIARSAGWLAHAFEQRLAGYLVRPRTKYVGSLD